MINLPWHDARSDYYMNVADARPYWRIWCACGWAETHTRMMAAADAVQAHDELNEYVIQESP